MLSALAVHILRPYRNLNLSYVSLAQEEHAQSGLTDAATYCLRKLPLQNRLLERKLRPLGTACFVKL